MRKAHFLYHLNWWFFVAIVFGFTIIFSLFSFLFVSPLETALFSFFLCFFVLFLSHILIQCLHPKLIKIRDERNKKLFRKWKNTQTETKPTESRNGLIITRKEEQKWNAERGKYEYKGNKWFYNGISIWFDRLRLQESCSHDRNQPQNTNSHQNNQIK